MSENEKKNVVVPNQNDVDTVIRNHVYTAIGAGMVPVPLVDLVTLIATEVNLARRLSNLYGKPFSESLVRTTISSLIGGVMPVALAPFAYSLLKMLPVVGYTASAASISIMGGAATYAIGRIFSKHFASGGTLETLSAENVKAEFASAYEEGKNLAKDAVQKLKPSGVMA